MGTLILPPSGQVYVDSNAVIYAIERIEPYRTLLEPLWQAAHDGGIAIITSELTWLETLTKPIRDQNPQLEPIRITRWHARRSHHRRSGGRQDIRMAITQQPGESNDSPLTG
jgi:hypothetical protein